MKTLLEIYNELDEGKRFQFMLKYPRYAIIYKGKEVRRYAFIRQALSYKIKHDSLLFSDHIDVVDTWTGENI